MMIKPDKASSRILSALLFIAGFLLLLAPGARATSSTTIDIMLVYDNSATTWVAGNGGREAFSLEAVNRMNLALLNSGVDLSFRLVHTMAVDYTTSASPATSMTADLQALQGGSGNFAAVHTARDQYGADLVAMLIDHGSASGNTGQAYLLSSWAGRPDYGFAVNAIQAVEIGHTMTHEVGHNFGAGHAKAQTADPGPNSDLADYSAGWYFNGDNGVAYGTIMSYWYDGYGNTYQEAPVFSSPLLTFQGAAAGDPQDGDNARLLRETKAVVAAYRQPQQTAQYTVTAASGSGGSIAPEISTVFHGAATIITAEPDSGYTLAEVSGNCPVGSRYGNSYTTGPIIADCSLSFSFTPLVPIADRYEVLADGGIIRDLESGLEWWRCAFGQTWDGATCDGNPQTFTWNEAEELSPGYGGHNDWRLPTPWELSTLVDFSNPELGVNAEAFPAAPAVFWSAATAAAASGSAWYVAPNSANINHATMGTNYTVRLVRGERVGAPATTPTAGFTDHRDGTVTHQPTGLTWMRCPLGQEWDGSSCSSDYAYYSWQDAMTAAEELEGWRLPTLGELLSIVEYEEYGPALNPEIFSIVPSLVNPYSYWTSSADPRDSGQAFFVGFEQGHIFSNDKSFAFFHARLVRDDESEPISYTVTPIAGSGGSLSPISAQMVNHGATTQFTISPASGYTASVGGTCGGSLVGSTYTTNAITGDCSVTASFSLNSYQVSATAGSGGGITPVSRTVDHGSSTSFTVSPDTGYSIANVNGCEGSLSGSTYTTGSITEACTVTVGFSLNSYTVSATAGSGGGITPASRTANHGSTTSFTVSPDTGYSIANVSGCEGSLSGSTYTTKAITADCLVVATFVAIISEYQQIITPGQVIGAAGDIATITVSYSTSDDNQELFGLGLRVHFDSAKLTWLGFDNVLQHGLISQDLQPVPDSGDHDGDTQTSHYLTTIWRAAGSAWPEGELPAALYQVRFRLAADLAAGSETLLRFSADETAQGYELAADPVQITVQNRTLDIDGDGEIRPLTDGLLVLRYLFGFRGETLTQGLIGLAATRTAATAIEQHLAGLGDALDIDDDGESRPLTDGLLVLRYLFGFRGEALIQGVTGTSGQCVTATCIEQLLDQMSTN